MTILFIFIDAISEGLNLVKQMPDNVFGLGEVAEPKTQIEKQNLIIKNKC